MEKSGNKPKVAVLMGGIGSERQISLQSGNSIANALKEAQFDVITADINPDNLGILEDKSIDIFFPAMHGKFGEDGELQKILEDKSLAYTGSGPVASKAAFNKIQSKMLFNEIDLNIPMFIEYDPQIDNIELKQQLEYLSDKFVIKPISEGSSVGVTIISSVKDAIKAAKNTYVQFGDCMIEEFIEGKELTVGILCGQALLIIEIKTISGFYDYQAKYVDNQTQYLFDTITDTTLIAEIKNAAMDCFNCLGCRHFSRVDFILSNDNKPYVLEVNTIPGFTSHSLLPKAAQKAGFSMSGLCEKIVETAFSDVAKPRIL